MKAILSILLLVTAVADARFGASLEEVNNMFGTEAFRAHVPNEDRPGGTLVYNLDGLHIEVGYTIKEGKHYAEQFVYLKEDGSPLSEDFVVAAMKHFGEDKDWQCLNGMRFIRGDEKATFEVRILEMQAGLRWALVIQRVYPAQIDNKLG